MPCSEKHCGNWTALALVSEMGNFRGALKAKAKETRKQPFRRSIRPGTFVASGLNWP